MPKVKLREQPIYAFHFAQNVAGSVDENTALFEHFKAQLSTELGGSCKATGHQDGDYIRSVVVELPNIPDRITLPLGYVLIVDGRNYRLLAKYDVFDEEYEFVQEDAAPDNAVEKQPTRKGGKKAAKETAPSGDGSGDYKGDSA